MQIRLDLKSHSMFESWCDIVIKPDIGPSTTATGISLKWGPVERLHHLWKEAPGRDRPPARSSPGSGHPRTSPEPPEGATASPGQPRPNRANLEFRAPPPPLFGCTASQTTPVTSGVLPPSSPHAAGRRWELLHPSRPVWANLGAAPPLSTAAAHRRVHGLPLGLQRRSVAIPSSSDCRLAADALEPERSCAGLISAAGPPVAAGRRPAPPPDPSDRLVPSPVGALAVRPQAASPSSHCSGKWLFHAPAL
uniref:Uncharacterized protein n=1 Tax=Ananas comosus var. bracteatus TaxID=296719 RepID=A0A6V7Q6V8_ANACO|nr:unnamed protein product [Ananas comosus var. bracteatus]